MASNKSVVVLAPNGRRQTVKVTPNTTILQIIEEVCKKQGYQPDEYDIKHHNHILDTSSIIRFSGLPNNAQLEMCDVQKVREESPVILGVQLENGTRLTGNFIPGDNLWHVIVQLCPEQSEHDKNPVVIYMRQEIYNTEALKNTSLRSLGITGGRAMLRIINRKPEELKTQANVSMPLPSKPVEEKPYRRKLQTVETSPEQINSVPDKSEKTQAKRESDRRTPSPEQPKKNLNIFTEFLKKEKNKKSLSPPRTKQVGDDEAMEVEVESEDKNEKKNKIKFKDDARSDEFVFLGERNALAFSLEMAQAVPHEDLPDEFYELTIQDARRLFHDMKKKREELEENPLQTTALRNLEQSKKVLRHITQYKKSVIRVQFPDRTVLQGTFKPLENIEHVMDFVKDYLQNPTLEFHLYTTPPKSILDPTSTLVEAECVPSAVMHFGVNKPVDEKYKYLREDIFSKFISPSMASVAASKFRIKESCKTMYTHEMDTGLMQNCDTDVNVGASTSKAGTSSVMTSEEPSSKVPKWFKKS